MNTQSTSRHRRSPRQLPPRSTRRKRVRSARTRLRAVAPPRQNLQQEASAPRSPLQWVCVNAEVSNDRFNLLRSSVSDEDGSYLVMSVEVPVPFTAAYDAWTRFEHAPHFMRGRDLAASNDGSRMTWRIRTLFDEFAWQAKVSEQVPFEFIAWKSVLGAPHPGFGSVSFEPISHHRTWILVQVGFDMSGIYRWLGDPLPSLSRSLEQSLKRFHDSLAIQPSNPLETQPICPAKSSACLSLP